MSTGGRIQFHRSADAIHFTEDGVEFLEPRRGGECLIHSLAPDGIRHEHAQHHPGLLELLAGGGSGGFAICVEALPVAIQEHFKIPSVIVLIPNVDRGTRLLMAREPLGAAQLDLLRSRLSPFAGVLTEKGYLVHRPTGGE